MSRLKRLWWKTMAAALGVLTLTLAFGGVSALAGTAHRATAKRGGPSGTIVIALPSDMQNLDPTLSSADEVTQEVLTNLYSWLIDYSLTQKNGETVADVNHFVGGAAASWQLADGGKTIIFHLRPGIKFANGDPLNAQAVKFTYDRIYGQKGVTALLMGMAGLKSGADVQVLNNTTVAFHLTQANDLFFGNMAQFGNSILDPKVVQAHATASDPYAHNWLSTHSQGTESGPYTLQSWQPGNQVVLTRNPNFWGTVRNQKVILKIIPDPSSRLADVESGAVDVAEDIPTNQVKTLTGNPNVTVHVETSRQIVYLGMNNSMKPFNNRLVREAFSYAIPYKTIVQQALNGYGIQLTSVLPQGTPYHTSKYFVYKTDYAKARALLARAGYKHGLNVTLTIPDGLYDAEQTAVWVQSGLRNIGVNVTIQKLPGASYEAQLQRHALPFFYAYWTSINNDPFYHMYWLLESSCCDYANYQNPTVTSLINKNLLSTNAAQRQAAADKIQQLVAQDAPWILLYQPDFITVTHKGVKGYVWYSDAGYLRYRWLYKQ
jgi:peptide/nickel transport system substrate-binding protein